MKRHLLHLILLVFIISSCTEFRKIKKGDDVDKKFELAQRLFKNESYHKSILLFDDILPALRGDERAEIAQYMYAKCHLGQKRYIESAYYFKNFYQTYSRSTYAEEAEFLTSFSLYKQAPYSALDQSPTQEAITAFQQFLNKFPNSSYKEKSETYMDEMRSRLEQKAYENAMLYFKLQKYDPRTLKSAIIALNNFERDFPESTKMHEVGFTKLDAMYKLAQISTFDKKSDRFDDFEEAYILYIEEFETSDYLKKAEWLYNKVQKEQDKLGK